MSSTLAQSRNRKYSDTVGHDLGILNTLLYGPSAAADREIRLSTGVTDIQVAFAAAMDALSAVQEPDYGIPAVFRGTQFIADTVASLSMIAVDDKSGLEVETPDLLKMPNPTESYQATVGKIVYSLLFRGNAYLMPLSRSNAGQVQSFMVLNPGEVEVAWDKRGLYPVYSWRDRAMIADTEIIHIPLNLYPGAVQGVSPFTAAANMMTGARSEIEFARRLFTDDATPPLAIKVPGQLSKTEADALLDQWETKHLGRKRPAVLSGGVEVEVLGISPIDAQFIEERRFSVLEVCRLLGIPGYFLSAEDTSLTYTTTEGVYRHFVTSTLNPTYLERIAGAVSRMLPHGTTAAFDTGELTKADTKSRYESYNLGLQGGWLTINEVRVAEGLPPIMEGN